MNKHFKNTISILIIFCFAFSIIGCTTLKPNEYEPYGYHGTAQVKEGIRVIPIDWLGNLFGVLYKLILWNWKVKRHHILEDTEKAVDLYLADPENKEVIGDVAVQLNRYAPQDAWRRLVHNKGVKWPYRLLIGTFVVLIVDTLLIDRIFGGDRYNPFTHTVHIHSDIPAVALHELGHAKDFAERRYRGSYALFRIIPFADLYQEYQATDEAFEYVREKQMVEQEIENYKVLYPAYGTYTGTYVGSVLLGAIVGHIWGRSEARELKKELKET